MEFLKGSGVAMITPFDEGGLVDYNAIKRIVEQKLWIRKTVSTNI